MTPSTTDPLARTAAPLSAHRRDFLRQSIARALQANDAVLVAHHYVDGDLQDLALATGGCLADSLEMARFGHDHPARTLVVAGVRFMGETAKILSPAKRVLMPDLRATCSLDLGCPPEDFSAFCDGHPDRTVVVYANTSAAVKARADWTVTSASAVPVISHLKAEGRKLVWGPDRHLGRYIQRQTGADMLMWDGACVVHDEFKALELGLLCEAHPEALVLAHPEAPAGVLDLADVVGSTTRLLRAVIESAARSFIVATDAGLLHRMRQLAPGKTLIAAPTAGEGATCKSCAHCPWMAMNGLPGVLDCLERGRGEIHLPPATAEAARVGIRRMLDFVAAHPATVTPSVQGFVPHLGAA